MIVSILGGNTATPWMRAALRYGTIALAIALFLLSIRRAGESIGRISERLDITEKANEIQRQMLEARLAVLVIVTSRLTGCATAGFEQGGTAACPPVVEYSRELQARGAEEVTLLSDGSAVVEMMGDYAVMREQANAC